MLTRILILNDSDYAITSLVMLILGSFYIADQINKLLPKQIINKLLIAHIISKFLILCYGMALININGLFEASMIKIIMAIILGYLFACCLIKLQQSFLKHHYRFKKNNQKLAKNDPKKIFFKLIKDHIFSNFHYLLCVFFFIAFIEEILFRGIFYILIQKITTPIAQISLIIFINIIFAASHISFGWISFICQFILAGICLLAIQCTHQIYLPIAIHGFFNVLTFKKNYEYFYESSRAVIS